MKKFTKFALFASALAGGYLFYKELEKQKQPAGDTFEEDDLFDDGEIQITAEDGEAEAEKPSKYEEFKAKAGDFAQKAKEKTIAFSGVVSEKAVKAYDVTKDYISKKLNSNTETDIVDGTAEVLEDAAEEVADEASAVTEDVTDTLENVAEDVADKVDDLAADIAADMKDAEDPE